MLAIRMGDGTVHRPPEELTQEFLASRRGAPDTAEDDTREPEHPWNYRRDQTDAYRDPTEDRGAPAA